MLTGVRMWLRALFLRERVETEMEKEMRLHLEMETEENVRRGMSPADARRAARVAFGGVDRAKEEQRDARLTRGIEQLIGDLRFALRSARQNPGFTAAVAALLALGIGANAALFGVMYNLILSPLPYRDGNRMVRLPATANGGQIMWLTNRAAMQRFAASTRAAEQVTLLKYVTHALGDSGGPNASHVYGVAITPGAMAYVGARPLHGRDLTAGDTSVGAPKVAMLGYDLWQRHYGGRPDVVGGTIHLDGNPHAIIAVMPPRFDIPFFRGDKKDVFTALASGDTLNVDAIAKIARGGSLQAIDRELAAASPRTVDPQSGMVIDAPRARRAGDLVNRGIRAMVFVLAAAVAVLLLIASANVANLLMARAWNRKRELAVRAALGAARRRLFQQLFVESSVLAGFGGVLGVGVAWASLRIIGALAPDRVYLALDSTGMAASVLWATTLLAVASTIVFGAGPALLASGGGLLENLRLGARHTVGSTAARRLRSVLVVAEVALSVVLLTAAGLMLRTLHEMRTTDVGMNPNGLSAVRVLFTQKQFPTAQSFRAALSNARDAIRARPGVQAVTVALSSPPNFASGSAGYEIEGQTLTLADSARSIAFNYVTSDFFRMAGIRIVRGRGFSPSEDLAVTDSATEAIVNEAFARRYWPSGDALGQRVRYGRRPWARIVGIANDVRVPGEQSRTDLQMYQPLSAASRLPLHFIVRSSLPHEQVVQQTREAITEAIPTVSFSQRPPVSAVERFERLQQPQRFMLKIIGIFAGLALLLAAVGLHAVVAYAVGQRLREFGVRMALGADPSKLLRMVHGQGIALVATGLLLGIAGGMAATRLMRAMLFGVGPGDPLTMAGVATVLIMTALLATHLPARRAMRVNPVTVLREE